MRHARRPHFALLAAAFLAAAAPARAQQTTPVTTPTIAETQHFTLTVPGPPSEPVALPNRSRAQPVTGPLPRTLAYTGTDPLLVVLAGFGVVALSLLARRWTRSRCGAA